MFPPFINSINNGTKVKKKTKFNIINEMNKKNFFSLGKKKLSIKITVKIVVKELITNEILPGRLSV